MAFYDKKYKKLDKHTKTHNDARFSKAVHSNIKTSTFRQTPSLWTAFNASQVIPIKAIEVLPGDRHKIDMNCIMRMRTPLFPTMDDVRIEYRAFFVPNRIVWDGWEELCGENKTGPWAPAEAPALVPTFDGLSPLITAQNSIADYYGIDPGFQPLFAGNEISSLIFRDTSH